MNYLSYYFLVLCILLFTGCKDDDSEDGTKVYPTENQSPFDINNCTGRLTYDENSQEWLIMTHLPDITYGDEEWALLIVKNMPEDYKKYEGEIVFSGSALYLYYEILNEGMTKQYVYSIQLSNISKSLNASQRSLNAEVQNCITPASEPPSWIFAPQTRSVNITPYILDVFVHVVRSSSGQGYDKTNVSQTVINNLNRFYSSSQISFYLVGSEYIDSDAYNDDLDVSNYQSLFKENSHDDALDIYVLSSGSKFNAAGVAQAIPATACIINSFYYETTSLPHEVGHCLGLYHTHHGTVDEGKSDTYACSELVNGSNSETCGDYITDTPADPNMWSGCNYIGTLKDANGDSYTPDPTNLMSYSGKICRKMFTQKQIERMNLTIQKTIALQKIIHKMKIEGPKHFCMNGTYSIKGLLGNENVIWKVVSYIASSSMDDQPLSERTNKYFGKTLTLSNPEIAWPQYYEINAEINHPNGATEHAYFTATSNVPSPYMGKLYWNTDDGQYGETTNMSHGNTLFVSGRFLLSLVYEDKAGNMSRPYTSEAFSFIFIPNSMEDERSFSLEIKDCIQGIKITPKNSCGPSPNSFIIPCEIGGAFYSAYLPETSQIEIKVVNPDMLKGRDVTPIKLIESIDIYTNSDEKIYSKNYVAGTVNVKISTVNWKSGEYRVIIFDGKDQYKRKVTIK